LGSKKQKPQSAIDSGAEIAEPDDGPEPEEVMMVKVTLDATISGVHVK
jgi:hypothetical protein